MTVYRKEQREWSYSEACRCMTWMIPGREVVTDTIGDSMGNQYNSRGETQSTLINYLREHGEACVRDIRAATNLRRNSINGALTTQPNVFRVVRYDDTTGLTKRIWGLVTAA